MPPTDDEVVAQVELLIDERAMAGSSVLWVESGDIGGKWKGPYERKAMVQNMHAAFPEWSRSSAMNTLKRLVQEGRIAEYPGKIWNSRVRGFTTLETAKFVAEQIEQEARDKASRLVRWKAVDRSLVRLDLPVLPRLGYGKDHDELDVRRLEQGVPLETIEALLDKQVNDA